MESFSLLKYWRGTAASATVPARMRTATTTTTTIAASALRPLSESDTEEDGNDEGPFFDLEFALPDDDSDSEAETINEHDGGSFAATDEEEEGEFKFAVSPAADSSDPSLTLSPSDDLFFKGRLVPLDPDSKPQQAVPLLKTATKLRVLMLALRKPKATAEAAVAAAATVTSSKAQQQRQSKFFIKFKVDEVPIVSLFTRDNSSRGAGRAAKPQAAEDPTAATEERTFTKEVVQKYLSKIKPLYLKVSKRYIEKMRFAGEPNDKEQIDGESSGGGSTQSSNEEAVAVENGGVGKRQIAIVSAGLKVVYKKLGKSRSASSAVAAAPSPPPPPPTAQRRDDSLLQQQDGIQSAILHCKRSFNAARDSRLPPVSDEDGVMSEVDEEGQA